MFLATCVSAIKQNIKTKTDAIQLIEHSDRVDHGWIKILEENVDYDSEQDSFFDGNIWLKAWIHKDNLVFLTTVDEYGLIYSMTMDENLEILRHGSISLQEMNNTLGAFSYRIELSSK